MAIGAYPDPRRKLDRRLVRSKLRAFLVHLGISAVVVGAVCALIFIIWYPQPYFQATGAWNVLRVLVGVDLVLGPSLTLFLFRPAKPGLAFDLSVVAVIQLVALVYGTTVIYQERPYFTVFAVDRFQVLAEKDVDLSRIGDEQLKDKPAIGPLLAVAVLPEDPAQLQKLLDEVLFQGQPDIERRPELWQPYAERSADVVARARPLSELMAARPEAAGDIERLVRELDRQEATLGYVPLVAKHRDFAFVIDMDTGRPIEVIDVDPWIRDG